MKIAIVFDMMLWGGIERVGISYVKLLTEAGHTVDAYILNPETESIIEELKNLCNVQVINFSKKTCPEGRWHIVKYRNKFGLEIFAFAIVYVMLNIKNAVLKSRYSNKRQEYDFAIAFSGHINDLTYVANNYIKAKHKIAWLHGTQYSYNILSPGFFRLYRKIGNLVCLSDIGDQECEAFNKMSNIRKKKIYNPCIINESLPDERIVNDLNKKYGEYCLMVARLANDKDQATAIRAMKYLKDYYSISKHLVLVGDGNKRKELEQLVDELDMHKWIHFEGSRSDVQNYYSSAYLLVHSAPLEGLPTVFLEAMKFGVPIASTDAVPGAREVLGNNEYGLLSPIGDFKELAKSIKTLYQDKNIREELIKKENIRINDFAPDKIFNEFSDYLNEIKQY